MQWRTDKNRLVKHEGCSGCGKKGCQHNGNVADKEVAERSKRDKFGCNDSAIKVDLFSGSKAILI
uniref:Uncharacterized protein n=1 Tax=viral metagenome TaxID=1070528 RepID=A0A6M3LYZ4_9ZZZZ